MQHLEAPDNSDRCPCNQLLSGDQGQHGTKCQIDPSANASASPRCFSACPKKTGRPVHAKQDATTWFGENTSQHAIVDVTICDLQHGELCVSHVHPLHGLTHVALTDACATRRKRTEHHNNVVQGQRNLDPKEQEHYNSMWQFKSSRRPSDPGSCQWPVDSGTINPHRTRRAHCRTKLIGCPRKRPHAQQRHTAIQPVHPTFT